MAHHNTVVENTGFDYIAGIASAVEIVVDNVADMVVAVADIVAEALADSAIRVAYRSYCRI